MGSVMFRQSLRFRPVSMNCVRATGRNKGTSSRPCRKHIRSRAEGGDRAFKNKYLWPNSWWWWSCAHGWWLWIWRGAPREATIYLKYLENTLTKHRDTYCRRVCSLQFMSQNREMRVFLSINMFPLSQDMFRRLAIRNGSDLLALMFAINQTPNYCDVIKSGIWWCLYARRFGHLRLS